MKIKKPAPKPIPPDNTILNLIYFTGGYVLQKAKRGGLRAGRLASINAVT